MRKSDLRELRLDLGLPGGRVGAERDVAVRLLLERLRRLPCGPAAARRDAPWRSESVACNVHTSFELNARAEE